MTAAQNRRGEEDRQLLPEYSQYRGKKCGGIAPIQPYLDAIDQAKTIEELMAVQNRVYEETGGTLFMGFGLNIDVKDNTAYTLLFDGITPSLGQEDTAPPRRSRSRPIRPMSAPC